MALVALPATPLAIELSFCHNRPWWKPEDGYGVQSWRVSADVNQLVPCGEVLRHVADIAVDIRELRDAAGHGNDDDWGRSSVAECVADEQTGRLHPDLEERISPGVPQAVVLRSIVVTEPWRGQRLAELLLASMLRFWARSARLTLCRVTPGDFAAQCPDPVAGELAAMRMIALLERLGFFPWRDVYVADNSSSALREACEGVVQLWWPDRGDSHA